MYLVFLSIFSWMSLTVIASAMEMCEKTKFCSDTVFKTEPSKKLTSVQMVF